MSLSSALPGRAAAAHIAALHVMHHWYTHPSAGCHRVSAVSPQQVEQWQCSVLSVSSCWWSLQGVEETRTGDSLLFDTVTGNGANEGTDNQGVRDRSLVTAIDTHSLAKSASELVPCGTGRTRQEVLGSQWGFDGGGMLGDALHEAAGQPLGAGPHQRAPQLGPPIGGAPGLVAPRR